MWRRVKAILVWAALVIIAAVSVGSAAWMIYEANSSEIAYKQFAHNGAKADAERANKYIKGKCGPLAPPDRAKCEAEEYYAAHQAQHDDRDLEAQRTTAVWTRYLGIAGIVGTAFGLLGVALVLFTFREQRKTSRAELRPYIFAERVTIYDGTQLGLRDDTHLIPYVEVVLKNSGNTPARNVRHSGGLTLAFSNSTEEPLYHTHLKQFTGQSLPPGGEHFHYQMLSATPLLPPGQGNICLTPLVLDEINHGEVGMMCYGKVIYDDVFGVEHFTEYRFFQTNFWPPNGGNTAMRYAGRGNRDD
jgi:hypothetical protein